MLPGIWRTIAMFNPVVDLMSVFRWSFFASADVPIAASLLAIAVFTGCVWPWSGGSSALGGASANERTVRQATAIAHHATKGHLIPLDSRSWPIGARSYCERPPNSGPSDSKHRGRSANIAYLLLCAARSTSEDRFQSETRSRRTHCRRRVPTTRHRPDFCACGRCIQSH